MLAIDRELFFDAPLNFSEESLTAAKSLVASWHIDINLNIEDILEEVECALPNNLAHISYGVEDAINSGVRLRLLDQIDIRKEKLNCAEVGLNVFLIYCALGLENQIRLMRFNDNQRVSRRAPIDHFAVLNYDQGLESSPWIVDPLIHKFGRIVFSEEGFVYHSTNSINRSEDPDRFKERLHPEDKPRLLKTETILLTKDEVIRHIHFINSPLGFLRYYEDGQRIKSEELHPQLLEYTVKVSGESLILKVTCFDKSADSFTFQRTYNLEDCILAFQDKIFVHTQLNWVDPAHVLYSES